MLLEIDKKPRSQFILILILCVISVAIFSIISILLIALIYGFNSIASLTIDAMKLMQLLTAIGLFVVPPILYGFITSKTPLKTVGLKSFSKPTNYLLVLLFMVAFTPFLSWIVELNANMVLPDFMSGVEQWMRDSELQAEGMIKSFLTFNGLGSLFYMLLIIAIVPAIGEELLFRGVLQKIFINWTNNAHIGIWISAILFSALHMQFFGFFPRFLLGLLFGYLFYWSNSLWLPILGHFINNGTVVIISYLNPELLNDTDAVLGNDSMSIFYYILSLIISGAIFFLIYKESKNIKPTRSYQTNRLF